MAKLAIIEQSDEELYDYVTEAKCLACGIQVDKSNPSVSNAIAGVLSALSAKKQSEVKAWEEEFKECSHTRNLEVIPIDGKVLDHCNDCDLKNNLWLCLTCGNVGCGRKHFDGSGGNGHGMAHYEASRHPVSCKLGTITPEGTAGGIALDRIVVFGHHG
jgi:ubiquitin carboxyl-terminal hydrolase 5/13